MFVFLTIIIKQNNTTEENYPYKCEEHQIFLTTLLHDFLHVCPADACDILEDVCDISDDVCDILADVYDIPADVCDITADVYDILSDVCDVTD